MPKKSNPQIGEVSHQLTITAVLGLNRLKKTCVACVCVCGNTTECVYASLKSGNTKSCGCLQKASVRKKNYKHGLLARGSEHPLFGTWVNMISRCTNPNDSSFDDYGGRGILVCERWMSSFATFVADMGEKPGDDYSIDRIDVNGNYEPANCRWATNHQQNRNKRNNRTITVDGETMICADWAKRLGICQSHLMKRVAKMGEEAAIKTPIKRRKK